MWPLQKKKSKDGRRKVQQEETETYLNSNSSKPLLIAQKPDGDVWLGSHSGERQSGVRGMKRAGRFPFFFFPWGMNIVQLRDRLSGSPTAHQRFIFRSGLRFTSRDSVGERPKDFPCLLRQLTGSQRLIRAKILSPD